MKANANIFHADCLDKLREVWFELNQHSYRHDFFKLALFLGLTHELAFSLHMLQILKADSWFPQTRWLEDGQQNNYLVQPICFTEWLKDGGKDFICLVTLKLPWWGSDSVFRTDVTKYPCDLKSSNDTEIRTKERKWKRICLLQVKRLTGVHKEKIME